MGKIVKFCNSCEEGFAEKFTFCPNCGGKLSVYEMNPIQSETKIIEEPKSPVIEESAITEMSPLAKTPVIEIPKVENPKVVSLPVVENLPITEEKIIADEPILEAKNENETIWDDEIEEIKPIESKVTISSLGLSKDYEPMPSSMYRQNVSNSNESNNENFHLTIIEDPKRNERRVMLLGYGLLILALLGGWWVYSLFTKAIDVAALGGNDDIISIIPDIEPNKTDLEEKDLPKTAPGKGGGGGGGGRNDPLPVSQGKMPPQFKDPPLLTPSKEDISVTNPDLKVTRGTKGPQDIIPPKKDGPMGVENSLNKIPSDGTGKEFGMGRNGRNGVGYDGEDGIGSLGKGGIGNSPGNKYGSNPGNGGNLPNDKDDPPPVVAKKPTPPPTPKAPAVTQGLRILSQPKPGYTDAARTNNVTGVVRLRVTFSANGSIGGITTVSGLPYGLTEQAIAAARAIRFEPKKVDGVPQSVTKVMEYTFTIY